MPDKRKCIFVTGGSHGIGSGICEVFANRGYDVAFTYNSRVEGAEETAALVEKAGARCLYYKADLALDGVAEEITARAIKDLGRIDVLMNNAGMTKHNYFRDSEADFYDFVFNLNFRAPMMCTKVAANFMIDHGIKGNILFTSSSRSQQAYAIDPAYGGCKAGLNRACESLALQLSPYGIRVNVVAPGFTVTTRPYEESQERAKWLGDKIPLKRGGTPHDVAYAAYFLCSEEASYITGIPVRIDGGLILPGMPEVPDPEFGIGWGSMDYDGWGRPTSRSPYATDVKKEG